MSTKKNLPAHRGPLTPDLYAPQELLNLLDLMSMDARYPRDLQRVLREQVSPPLRLALRAGDAKRIGGTAADARNVLRLWRTQIENSRAQEQEDEP